MVDELGLATLKDGSKVPLVAVNVILISLRHLLEDDGIAGVLACYELREICRDPNHRLSGSSAERLEAMALLDINRQPHEIVQQVVLNAVVGEDLAMTLDSPLASS